VQTGSSDFLCEVRDLYKTVREEASDSFIVEKSEFIGRILPVKTEEEAIAFIDKVRSENRKARHNCYAYVLSDGNITRYSDDAEPQGTAGPPILDVIQKSGLSDVCIVVTRYFGGILLGKGGLTRAYSNGASIAVSAAKVMEMYPAYEVTAICDYSFYDRISYALPEFEVKITGTDYSDKVSIHFAIKKELFPTLERKLMDLTNGGVSIEKSDEILFDFAQ